MSGFDSLPKNYKHECTLRTGKTIDIFKELIDSGIFIEIRRKWHSFCVIDDSHPEATIYYKSVSAIKQEIKRQMILYRYKIHPFSMFA